MNATRPVLDNLETQTKNNFVVNSVDFERTCSLDIFNSDVDQTIGGICM